MIYFVVIALYESIKKSGDDYGSITNYIILSLAEFFQYPANLIFNANDGYYLLRILINLSVYSMVIYFVIKFVFAKIKQSYNKS